MLQWIIDGVLERQESINYVMRTVFLMNFVSIHTTSNVGRDYPPCVPHTEQRQRL